MTKDDAEALGALADRMTRPVMTMLFGVTICWIGVRSIQNISADQFVGIVMAVVLFWFGSSRPATAASPNGTTLTTTNPATLTATTTETKP